MCRVAVCCKHLNPASKMEGDQRKDRIQVTFINTNETSDLGS